MSFQKQHLFQRLLTVALLLGVFMLSAGTIMFLAWRGRTVYVPNVIGKTEAAAAEELEDAGLRLQRKGRAHNDQIPLDAVCDQSPTAGSVVKTGQLVRVSLSLGAPPGETKPEKKTASKSASR
ncbi:MAG: PASTA domain-containing protein [Acidobacteria bacterium]|nr:PASTA domain-containing protein [Acidobacteriota bacterium]MBI3422120.1 PASTA domain-containing protein [Acidobacteriota bacterium]